MSELTSNHKKCTFSYEIIKRILYNIKAHDGQASYRGPCTTSHTRKPWYSCSPLEETKRKL